MLCNAQPVPNSRPALPFAYGVEEACAGPFQAVPGQESCLAGLNRVTVSEATRSKFPLRESAVIWQHEGAADRSTLGVFLSYR